MKIFGYTILTDRDLTRMIHDGAASLAERRASQIMRKYAHNPACQRASFAARHRLPAEHVILADGMAEVEARAITAFADAMGRERGEATP